MGKYRRWCHVAAALLLLGLWPDGRVAEAVSDYCWDECHPTARMDGIANAKCLSDCDGCVRLENKGCSKFFFPVWYSGDDGSTVQEQQYYSFYCVQTCQLQWWAWVLIVSGLLLITTSVALCCYGCHQRRKRNQDASYPIAHVRLTQGSLNVGVPYTQAFLSQKGDAML